MRWGTLFFFSFFLYWCSSRSSFRLYLDCEHRFNQSVGVPLSFAAKHHCLSQPGRPEWLTLPAGRHGGPSVYVAPGEGGANGRHSGTQRLACGAARRGPLFIIFSLSFLFALCLSTCLISSIPPICFSTWHDQLFLLLVDFAPVPFSSQYPPLLRLAF